MIKLFIIAAFFCLLLPGCVQKTYTKTVVYILNLQKPSNIKTVGLRGKDKPLDWQSDFEMKKFNSDSTFIATVTYVTGYKFTEAKFVVNGEFEFQNEDNRRVVFSDRDTTVYTATFNSRN